MWCVSTDNNIGYEGANVLSQCLTQLTQLTHLDLSCECYLTCGVWCYINVTWVQLTILETREQRHWVSAWYISHTLTWVVSVYIDVLLGVCDVWCHIDVCAWEYRERHWIWRRKGTESVLVTLDTSHTPWLELWVCALMCVMWCHIDNVLAPLQKKRGIQFLKILVKISK